METIDVWIAGVRMADYGLMLRQYGIPFPQPKTNYLDIPGSNSSLDYTEAFGRVFYSNREGANFQFDYIGEYEEFESVKSALAALLHGKKSRIIIGSDPDYFYEGRLALAAEKNNDVIGSISIEGSLEPYKYRTSLTEREVTVSGNTTITLDNLFMPVAPDITAAGTVEATFNNRTVSLAQGTVRYADIVLEEGGNTITFTGEGTVTISYREGTL